MEGYEAVFEEKIAELASYRKMESWQRYGGAHESLEDIRTDAEEWRDVGHPLVMEEKGEYWFKTRYAIPSHVKEIPLAGTDFFLRCFYLAPTQVFVNGKIVFDERYWADFQMPEVVLAREAAPGASFEIIVHVTHDVVSESMGDVLEISVFSERIEDVLFQMQTFLHGLKYCAELEETRELLERARSRLREDVTRESRIGDVLKAMDEALAMLSPAREHTKRQRVHLVGHAHIDMNWLWPMEETVRICRRDFGTMIELMDECEDFRFSQSQAVVYEIARTHFPGLFDEMKEKIKKGQWEVTASTWTEGDLNMADGESIARHLLYSRKYTEEHFAMTSRVCWEPDTFGHPASMPQILKKSGIDYYYHYRCGKGHPLYWWEGIEGSRVLAFNSLYLNPVKPDEISQTSALLRKRCGVRDSLFVYGVCDHGGGPTRREMRRARFLEQSPVMPRVVMSTAHEFFDAVRDGEKGDIPVIRGELNPVFDGGYSSHADVKRMNRRCERDLLRAEALAVIARCGGRASSPEALEKGWKLLLFNQFHDIFAGCAVQKTYELVNNQLNEARETAEGLIRESIAFISSRVGSRGNDAGIAVWNLEGFSRTDVVRIPLDETAARRGIMDANGQMLPSQEMDGNLYFIAQGVPSMGYKVYYLAEEEARRDFTPIKDNEKTYTLGSKYLELDVEKRSACVIRMTDRESGKRIIEPKVWRDLKINNTCNMFTVDYEMPHTMSSWVIGPVVRAENLIKDARVTIKSDGPVMQVLGVEHRIGASTIHQEVIVYRELRRVDFRTRVQWNETSDSGRDAPMLRVAFMPELSGSVQATFDIPFGSVQRINDGTECPALKWVDVSDEHNGLSLLNDGTYGFSVDGSTIRMTCVRTSYSPDPDPDSGLHELNYALYPHAGRPREAGTVKESRAFNNPLIPVRTGNGTGELPRERSWIGIDADNVLLSALKPSAYDDAIVVRAYETGAAERTNARMTFPFPLQRVREVTIPEDRVVRDVPCRGTGFDDCFGRHEIKTYRVYA